MRYYRIYISCVFCAELNFGSHVHVNAYGRIFRGDQLPMTSIALEVVASLNCNGKEEQCIQSDWLTRSIEICYIREHHLRVLI